MPSVRVARKCSTAELDAILTQRVDIVAELPGETTGTTTTFDLDHGPFRSYQRQVTATPSGPDHHEVVETTTSRLAVPVFGWLMYFPVRHALRNRRARFGYWWAPPDRFDAHSATVLGLLAAVQVVDGYLGTVLTQTITFAADEFGHGNTAQGLTLAAVRFGVLVSLAAVALADRRGRKSLLVLVGVTGCAFTFAGGLAPNFWVLGGSQLIARGLSTALGILIVIIAAEEMPARSRAWAASVLVLSAGLGSGMAVWILPVADLDIRGWRLIYLVAGLGIAVVRWAGTRLPETRRFVEATTHPPVHDQQQRDRRRERLILLAASAFLIAMFAAPASSFQNDFLKDERGFDATAVSLFTVVTATPAGLGVLVGGYLAERRGRRRVGAFGLAAGSLLTTTAFFMHGAPLWIFTLCGVIIASTAVPALAVYGPELFGTHDRGRANGIIVTVGVAGSAVGLLVAGLLTDHWDGELGRALAILALGPLSVAGLVLTRYPETAGVELEDLNPEDR